MEYKEAVKKFMEGMRPQSEVIIYKLCKKDSPIKFINTVKDIMQSEWSTFGWKFQFNEDFTKLKRCSANNLVTFEQWIKN